MTKITQENVHNYCRTCLNELEQSAEKYDIRCNNVAELVIACTAFTAVENNDDFPMFLCNQCFKLLQQFHEFKLMSIRSKLTLSDLLVVTVKVNTNENVQSGKSDDIDSHLIIEKQENGLTEVKDDKHTVMSTLMENEFVTTETGVSKSSDLTAEFEVETTEVCFDFNEIEPLVEHHSDVLENNTKISCLEEFGKSDEDVDDEFLNAYASENSSDTPISNLKNSFNNSSISSKVISAKPSTAKRKCRRSITKDVPTKKFEIKYQCVECPRRCISKEYLEAHMRTHQGLKPFQCEHCSRSFNKAYDMRLHTREIHTGTEQQILCEVEGCGKIFRRDASYKVHFRLKHAGIKLEWKSYMCEECGRTFKNNTLLREHRYKHSPQDSPYQCEHCNKRYTSQRTYKEHLLRHAGIKNFECPYCGMKKTTRNELRTHINYHTKERQWPCKLCPSIFYSSANLGMHDRVVHKGIRRFSCRFCDQSFGKPDTLKHHEMRHTGEKPHVCNICEKRFIQIVALRAHIKTHNKNNGKGGRSQYKFEVNDPQMEVTNACMQLTNLDSV